jgi:hypothetical protein
LLYPLGTAFLELQIGNIAISGVQVIESSLFAYDSFAVKYNDMIGLREKIC